MQLEFNKLLLISCHFPPAGGIQVQRALSLARYLPSEGFAVHVLTVKDPRVPTLDCALLQQVPAATKIHRTRTLEPPFYLRKRIWGRIRPGDPQPHCAPTQRSSLLRRMLSTVVERALCPDPQILWFPAAFQRARSIVRREGIGNILITAPPFSAFLIGNRLKQWMPQLRLITDYRDEWLDYYVQRYGFCSAFARRRAAQIERRTIVLSDLVVAATPAARDTIRARYPGEPGDKFRVVSNGFDEEALSGFTPRPHGTGKIVVVYAGTVYEPASPGQYLDALDALPASLRSRFETRFVGRVAEEFDRSVFDNRKSEVKLFPFAPHKEALRHMEEADVLLLPWDESLNVPGKFYEYMATGKPVLALINKNCDLAEMIRRTSCGWVVERDQPQLLAQFLAELARHSRIIDAGPISAEIQRYTRIRLTSIYASFIRGLDPATAPDREQLACATAAD